jgi:hypothetical protein
MRRTITAAAFLAAVLAGCSSKPDAAACEQALRANYQAAQADPNGPPMGRPAACKGVDDKTLQDIATKILAGQ